MQTFLPHKNFSETARVLDRMRLGKQRVETMQIMNALLIPEKGWKQHPATKMWRGYELALLRYQEAICHEWTKRGYKDTCLEKTTNVYFTYKADAHESLEMPPWWGNEDLHASHRSNLLRKKAEYYNQFNWQEPDNLDYVWPV